MAVLGYPDLGVDVRVTLINSSVFTGYWDGEQWWVGAPDDANDLPLVNEFVASWLP